MNGIQEVVGSIPIGSTTSSRQRDLSVGSAGKRISSFSFVPGLLAATRVFGILLISAVSASVGASSADAARARAAIEAAADHYVGMPTITVTQTYDFGSLSLKRETMSNPFVESGVLLGQHPDCCKVVGAGSSSFRARHRCAQGRGHDVAEEVDLTVEFVSEASGHLVVLSERISVLCSDLARRR